MSPDDFDKEFHREKKIKDLKKISSYLPLLGTGVVCVGNWDFAIQRFDLIIKYSTEQKNIE